MNVTPPNIFLSSTFGTADNAARTRLWSASSLTTAWMIRDTRSDCGATITSGSPR
jgi:hypothetical protein